MATLGKRGVSTKIVLALGLVILVVIVLLIGVNLLAPVFSGTREHAITETVLSIDAIYAAPEDAGLVIKLPSSVSDNCKTKFSTGKIEFTECEAVSLTGGNAYDAYFTSTSKTIDEEFKRPNTFVFLKEYDETKGENKKLEIKAKLEGIKSLFF